MSPQRSAEIVRVAERALLVRFPRVELDAAVAKAQAVFFFLEAKARQRLSLKGKTEGEDGSEELPWKRETEDEERRSLKGKARDRDGGVDEAGVVGLVEEVVLGAGSVMVRFDSFCGSDDVSRLRAVVGELESSSPAFVSSSREHRVAVRYGGQGGPDLETVAREVGLSADSVVSLHAGAEYRVAFVGFSPGYPYLLGLPPELSVARLPSPRARVPAGSVGIAGPFSGIYPSATPGGWKLLGRLDEAETPLFDPLRVPPARFAPGDRVRFVPAGAPRR